LANAKVIDVRTAEEYEIGHVKGATNIPVDQIETRIAGVVPDKSAPLVVHCQSGRRSARAKATLDKLGYTQVTDLGSLANARKVVEGK
jgi:phage shock protein E